MKAVHNHILGAFYKRKYLESIETNEQSKDEQQANGNHLQTCKNREHSYSQEVEKAEDRILTGVGNMGETMCKYKNAYTSTNS